MQILHENVCMLHVASKPPLCRSVRCTLFIFQVILMPQVSWLIRMSAFCELQCIGDLSPFISVSLGQASVQVRNERVKHIPFVTHSGETQSGVKIGNAGWQHNPRARGHLLGVLCDSANRSQQSSHPPCRAPAELSVGAVAAHRHYAGKEDVICALQ